MARTLSWRVGSLGVLALAAAATGAAVVGSRAAPVVPQSAEVTAISGAIGEWEMTANLSREGESRALAGPMRMKHVGWCSTDGPEERTGHLRISFARFSSRIDARINVAGVDCTYSASLTDAYEGTMTCPDRKPVPMIVWLR